MASFANGMDFSACYGGSGGSVSISGSYNLDSSAELGVSAVMGGGAAYQERQVDGSGNNSLAETVFGEKYSVENKIASSGKISGNSEIGASNDGGYANTKTDISGKSGSVESASSSSKNTFLVDGWYSLDGNLQSHLRSYAGENGASIAGTASLLGIECYNDYTTQFLSSGDSAVITYGINQASNGDIGDFGMTAMNVEHSGNYAILPQFRSTSESKGYLFAGWQWPDNSGIQMQLANSTIPGYLNGQDVATAICRAANTWDLKTSKNLFAGDDHNNDTNTGSAAVANTSYTPKYSSKPISDGINTEAWTTGFSSGSSTIAVTTTWYSTSRSNKVTGYDRTSRYKALESDCWYNANFNWRVAPDGDTSKGAFDVQTISLHELGHTLGLADLYSKSNSDKIMYGYNDGSVKRTLTAQDTTGLQKLYGP